MCPIFSVARHVCRLARFPAIGVATIGVATIGVAAIGIAVVGCAVAGTGLAPAAQPGKPLGGTPASARSKRSRHLRSRHLRSPHLSQDAQLPQRSQRSAHAHVVAAYEGYWHATSRALDSRSAVRARAIMARFVPVAAAAALVRRFALLWRNDEVAYGDPVLHIVRVVMTGPGTAAVRDCIDLTHSGLWNYRTGQVVDGLGRAHDYLVTTLAREQGRWLVTGAYQVAASCAY